MNNLVKPFLLNLLFLKNQHVSIDFMLVED